MEVEAIIDLKQVVFKHVKMPLSKIIEERIIA